MKILDEEKPSVRTRLKSSLSKIGQPRLALFPQLAGQTQGCTPCDWRLKNQDQSYFRFPFTASPAALLSPCGRFSSPRHG